MLVSTIVLSRYFGFYQRSKDTHIRLAEGTRMHASVRMVVHGAEIRELRAKKRLHTGLVASLSLGHIDTDI